MTERLTTVLSYLEESAKNFANKVAFFDKDKKITFSELRMRAIDLAYVLQGTLAGRNNPVLVFLPKSVDCITAFMGILYSGNFYTPTDVRFPAEKVNSVIDTLHPSAVIVNDSTEEKFLKICNGIAPCKIINLDKVPESGKYEDSSVFTDAILDVDPVYVFFTSGSTGTPKGVIITNHNVIDYVDWAVKAFSIDEKTIMGSQSPFYFDISTQDIYATLKTGATLGIIPPTFFAFPVKALEFIKNRHINFLYWVPSAFVNVANLDLLKTVKLDEVRLIMFGGEVMPVKQMNYWKKYLPNLNTIANVYGPTEATVNCTYYIVDRDFNDSDVLPLGQACGNTGLVVLDDNEALVDKGMVNVLGELCVYGSSLSVGYWDDLEKTAEKYVVNPFCKHYRQLMYRTGDLVYYNERGELVFAGRKDFQIKHLGYRIELGEIESAAMGNASVTNVCSVYDNEKKEIVLFYQGTIGENELREYLLSVIPKYMVPTIYFKLKAFPYNDNGKIDRGMLKKTYLHN